VNSLHVRALLKERALHLEFASATVVGLGLTAIILHVSAYMAIKRTYAVEEVSAQLQTHVLARDRS